MRISGPRVDSEDWLSEEVILKEEPGGLGRSQGREEEEWPGGQDEVRLVVPGAFLAPSFPFEKMWFFQREGGGRGGEGAEGPAGVSLDERSTCSSLSQRFLAHIWEARCCVNPSA